MGCKTFVCNLVALLIVGLKPDTCLSHCLLVMTFRLPKDTSSVKLKLDLDFVSSY